MLEDLRGKAIAVTGASTGIGAAAARAFGAAGAKVAVHCNRSRKEADAVAAAVGEAGGEAVVVQADVTGAGAADSIVDAAVKAFGRLDVMVNNAGGMVARTPLADMDDGYYDKVMDLNCRSLLAGTRAAAARFRAQGGGGSIINTTSIAARFGGAAGAGLYAAAKGWVSTFTRGSARELVADGIRVNAVSPGVIDTPFHERYTSPQQMDAMRALIPMGRTGTSEECAGAFLFLASDSMSAYVTGQVIEVNGGQLMP